ncbi:MAG: TolC family protein [Lentisphaeria bacterium]|nr:TolC family protein [Lentisphaeria bacterium]
MSETQHDSGSFAVRSASRAERGDLCGPPAGPGPGHGLWPRSLTLGLLALCLCGGCAWYEDAFVGTRVDPERLRCVEPLDAAAFQRAAVPETSADPARRTPPDTPPPPRAPERLALTLEECRATALNRNLQLRASLIDPAVAAERISEEEARFEAVFNAETAYSSTDTPTSTTLEGSRVHHLRIETGVELPLRTGGRLRFGLADRRSKTNNAFSTLNPAYETDAAFSISQPLLRNAGRRTTTHGIRVAVYEHQASQAAARLEVVRVLAALDRVYWRLYAARRVLDVRRQDYALAEQQLETARRLVESGERSPVEVLRAEAALAGRLEAIIVAETGLRDRERELKRVLNREDVPLGSATVLEPATEPDPVHYALDAPRLVEYAGAGRMELLELELRLARDDSTVEYLRNQLLPLVTLDYVYNVNGLGESRWASYDLLAKRRFADHAVGITLLVPMGNEAAESRLRQALLARRQRLATRQDREALIEQEVLAACDAVEAAWQRILANRQSALLSGRLCEAERKQFALGLNTSTDVLTAQSALAGAQSAEVEALAEYQIALVDLAYATGTILGGARLRWEEESSRGTGEAERAALP